jgi:HEAT repeat protein
MMSAGMDGGFRTTQPAEAAEQLMMNDDLTTLAERAVGEERAQPELIDDGHDWPTAEEIGSSEHAARVAQLLIESPDPAALSAAAHVLGTMVNGHPEHAVQATHTLSRLLAEAQHPHLEWSIADALRLAWHASAVEPLLRLEGSASANVRRSVAEGLGSAMSDQVVPAGVEALVRLSQDPDESVRDWATFSLAQLGDDSPAVRAALRAGADDPDYDTRCEALLGLARRRDRDAVERVATELRTGRVGKLVVEAAAELGDPGLLEPLLGLQGWWDVDPELLARAIDASRSGAHA